MGLREGCRLQVLQPGSTCLLNVAGFLMQGVVVEMFGVILYPPVWAVVVLTCALGALVGAVNGVLIAYFRVPAFVATLGVLYVARGVALLMTNGLTFNNLGGRPELGNVGFDWLGFNRLFGVPIGSAPGFHSTLSPGSVSASVASASSVSSGWSVRACVSLPACAG